MCEKEETPLPEFSANGFDEELTPVPDYKRAANTASINFSGLLDEPLKLYEDLKSGCGGQLWPAGMVLAKHMLRYHRDKLQHSRILELGAGGGIVGLSVARGCRLGQPLYMTDQSEMESLMQHNIALNRLEDRVQARVLNWGQPLSAEIADFKPDIILAADCIYFEPAFPLLLQTLQDLLALSPAAIVFFCFNKRRRADMNLFKTMKKSFRVTEIEDDDQPVYSRIGVFLETTVHAMDQGTSTDPLKAPHVTYQRLPALQEAIIVFASGGYTGESVELDSALDPASPSDAEDVGGLADHLLLGPISAIAKRQSLSLYYTSSKGIYTVQPCRAVLSNFG
ncbi:putative methyltransferase-domain-containing protein [Podospora didyma]|uniref:Protein-lysine N-methyltransferase EFM6 n=1 Tax=Podospora didyma TaxID=330526 RepID=A0AAE0KMH3_9PEZI|nr:putative methyltransferase-domain-containing protein [Podospora didyma]